MATRAQKAAARRNIKKAQAANRRGKRRKKKSRKKGRRKTSRRKGHAHGLSPAKKKSLRKAARGILSALKG